MNKTELFFGMERPNGKPITSAEFAEFVDSTVTPVFPDGLTVLEGNGQWNTADRGLVREQSKVLVLLHDGMDDVIDGIRNAYKTIFNQDSVMRLDHQVAVSF